MLTVALQHRRRPVVLLGGQLVTDRPGRRAGLRRPVRGRGRRDDGSFLMSRRTRDRHQRRGRPPGQLRRFEMSRRRLRAVRRADRPAACSSSAPTTRGRAALGEAAYAAASPSDLRRGRDADHRVGPPPSGSVQRFTVRRPRASSVEVAGRAQRRNAAAAYAVARATRAAARPGRAGGWPASTAPAAPGAEGRGRRRQGLRQLRPPPDRDRRRPAGHPRLRRQTRAAGASWRSSSRTS